MISFAAERLIELEVGAPTGAAYGEKSAKRCVRRNGYGDRIWETRAGTVAAHPQLFARPPRAAPHGREVLTG